MAKKKNPQIVLKQSDVRRIKEETRKTALEDTLVLFFTVLHNKFDFDDEQLIKVFREVEYLASMVNETPHTITIEQLKKALTEDLGIRLVMGERKGVEA